MNYEIKTTTESFHKTVTTESILIAPEVEVRRITTRGVSIDGRSKTEDVVEDVIFTGKMDDPNFGRFHVVTPDFVERRKLGWLEKEDYSLMQDKPFSYITSGRPYEVVRLREYDSTMYDVHGNPLVVGVYFYYIDGRINDKYYDLKKLHNYLLTRDDVTLVKPRLLDALNDKGFPYLCQVPYYNRGGDCGSAYLQFYWHPSVEVYRAFLEKAYVNGKRKWDWKEEAKSFLGIEQFRVREYDWMKEEEEDDDDDE